MIKRLKDKFKHNGFDYEIVKRNSGLVILEQLKKDIVYGYEVHKVRLNTYPSSNGDVLVRNQYEQLAGDEDFGMYGWSYQSKELAMNKYISLGGN